MENIETVEIVEIVEAIEIAKLDDNAKLKDVIAKVNELIENRGIISIMEIKHERT